ncbi:MAG TPA: PH domain-containing protein [Candidatus Brevibacterium intestinigallinarum]|nr:PH domain-containing protein [Candidatus Brevibacterium intestinigallinarum]
MLRTVGLILAPLVTAAFIAASIAFTIIEWKGWRPAVDSVWMIGLGIALSLAILRFALIVARADEDGLFVRNIVLTRRYEWSQIVGVSYSEPLGDSWANLSLSDGTTAAVMAIQAADGPRAAEAANRLRILVDEHTPTGGTP